MKNPLRLCKAMWLLPLLCALPLGGQEAPEAVPEAALATPPAIVLFEPALFSTPATVSLPEWIADVGFAGGEVGGATSAWPWFL